MITFYLWRQTQLDESCLECGQVGFRLLTETQLEPPRLPEFAELPTFFLPLHPVDLASLARREWLQPTEDRGEYPYRTADDQAGGSDLASGDAALVVT